MTVDTPDDSDRPRPEAETDRTEPPAPANDTDAAAEAAPDSAPDAAAEPAAEPDPLAEIADLKDRLLRAVAEGENIRRRAQRDVEEARKYGAAGLARDLLTVADNLRRALDAVPAQARESNGELASLATGVELTERELTKALEKAGISMIDPIGEKLDPNLHQAMMQVPDAGAEPGSIVQVMQVGYKIHDRLLRPAMVGVAVAPAGSAGRQVDEQV